MPDEQDYYIDEDGNVQVKKEESKFEPVPADDYDLIIQKVEMRTGQDSGAPFFAIEHAITSDDEEFDNRRVWENISPSVAWRVTQLVEGVYGPQDEIEEGEMMEFNIFDLFGMEVAARVGIEEGRDGVPRNNIVRYYPAEEGANVAQALKPPKKKAAAKKKTTKKKPKKKPTRRKSTAK
jgi:hypothetical protein